MLSYPAFWSPDHGSVCAPAQEMLLCLCSSSGWKDSFRIVSRSSQVHLFLEFTCTAWEMQIVFKFCQVIQLWFKGHQGKINLDCFEKMEIRRLDPDLCSTKTVKVSGWHHVGSQTEGKELLEPGIFHLIFHFDRKYQCNWLFWTGLCSNYPIELLRLFANGASVSSCAAHLRIQSFTKRNA